MIIVSDNHIGFFKWQRYGKNRTATYLGKRKNITKFYRGFVPYFPEMFTDKDLMLFGNNYCFKELTWLWCLNEQVYDFFIKQSIYNFTKVDNLNIAKRTVFKH